MNKIFVLILAVALLFSNAYIAMAATSDENKLSLEVGYNFPYNSPSANGSIAIGVIYPFWGICRVSGDAQFAFINTAQIKPPGISAGAGVSIPLGGFNFVVDLKKGFDLSGGGINDYCNICDLGIDFKMSDRYTFRSYYRQLNNFGSQYNVTGDKVTYLGFGFDYKL
jgi:hypothetical protein